MRLAMILNRDGGTLRTLDLDAFSREAIRILEEAGHTVDVDAVAGSQFAEAIKRTTARDDIDGFIVGGGDGSISAAAAQAFRSGMPLGVLPAGTMNLFARSLGMPLNLPGALKALSTAIVRKVDIATANDRPFVHQFSIGLHARLVRLRNARDFASRRGKMMATASALLEVIRNPPTFEVVSDVGRGPERKKVSAVSVTNNPFGARAIPYADRLDGGVLGVYYSRAETPAHVLSLAIGAMMGRLYVNAHIDAETAHEVSLHFPKLRHDANSVIDGELVPLTLDVNLKIHPAALVVLAPAVA